MENGHACQRSDDEIYTLEADHSLNLARFLMQAPVISGTFRLLTRNFDFRVC